MVEYSFGSLIAIEILVNNKLVTRMLEAMNFKGRLVLIDGAPEVARTMFKPFEFDFDDVNFQIDLLTNILESYSIGSFQKVYATFGLTLKLIRGIFILFFGFFM